MMKSSLRVKILLIVLLPALLIGIVAIWISSTRISQIMDEKMISQLKTSANTGREFYETMNDGLFYQDEEGNVHKGDFIITGNNGMVDVVGTSGGIYATFFYQDERIVTNIQDENGRRMIGTKATDTVVSEVLRGGRDYFSRTVMIDGKQYYGYYVPVRQPGTGEIIGMFFCGINQSQIGEETGKVSLVIALVIFAILAVSLVVAFFIVLGMTNSIKRTVVNLDKLSEGILQNQEHEKDLQRKDEIGDIVQAAAKLRSTLINLIGNINQTVETLYASSGDIEEVVLKTMHNTNDINKAVDELSKSSLQQAISMEGVSNNVGHMGVSVQNTIQSVETLTDSAEAINDSSKSTVVILGNLDQENKRVMEAIRLVHEQTTVTHEYVKKIEKVMEMIRDIADETKMLSLNASIEAARAGEAGRGFSIVAEQVKKLSEESAQSTLEIEDVIDKLNQNSSKAVKTMEQVREIVRSQNEQIEKVLGSYETVNINIEKASEEVSQVSHMSREIQSARGEVVELVSELCAFSEENAQSTKVTSMATEDLAEAMDEMEGSVEALRDLAGRLANDIKIFKF